MTVLIGFIELVELIEIIGLGGSVEIVKIERSLVLAVVIQVWTTYRPMVMYTKVIFASMTSGKTTTRK